MNYGMLWLDADKRRSLEDKIQRAAVYYQDKYGHRPDWCLVHGGLLSEEKQVGTIQVRPAQHIARHHFLLGVAA